MQTQCGCEKCHVQPDLRLQKPKTSWDTDLPLVANVNSNHSNEIEKFYTKDNQLRKEANAKKTRSSVKSKVVVPNKEQMPHFQTEQFQFEEGDMISMEINDGGVAAVEFASEEEEIDTEYNSDSDSEANG